MICCTSCDPLVSVPVLSKITTVSFLAFSNAVLLRNNNPCVAERVVEIATTRGTCCHHDSHHAFQSKSHGLISQHPNGKGDHPNTNRNNSEPFRNCVSQVLSF